MIKLFLCMNLLLSPSICECSIDKNTEVTEDVLANVPINEVIVDNENVKITLLEIVNIDDTEKGKEFQIKFDIENKTDFIIGTDAQKVSINEEIIDETIIMMTGDIEAGKTGVSTVRIMELDGFEFPEIKGDIEFEIFLFSWKNFDYEERIPINIEL